MGTTTVKGDKKRR